MQNPSILFVRHVPGQCQTTARAPCSYDLGAGGVYIAFLQGGDPRGHIHIIELVESAAAAALTCALHFNELDSTNVAQDFSRFCRHTHTSHQVAGIMVRHQ